VPASRVRSAGFDDTLYLKAGVGEWLVRMAGALRPIVQQRWATFVAERSRDLVDVVYLDDFLFGSARASLQRVKSPLLEAQVVVMIVQLRNGTPSASYQISQSPANTSGWPSGCRAGLGPVASVNSRIELSGVTG
jgi:hypothetical protein